MFRVQLSAKWLWNTLLAANNNNNSCTKMNVCHWISDLAGNLEPQGNPTAGTRLLTLYSCHWFVSSTWGVPKTTRNKSDSRASFPASPVCTVHFLHSCPYGNLWGLEGERGIFAGGVFHIAWHFWRAFWAAGDAARHFFLCVRSTQRGTTAHCWAKHIPTPVAVVSDRESELIGLFTC